MWSFITWPTLVDPAGVLTSLTLQPPAFVPEVDWGAPVTRDAIVDRALQSGVVDLTQFHGARTVTISVGVNGSESGGHSSLRSSQLAAQIAGWTRPDLRPRITFRRDCDSGLRRVDVRPVEMSVDNPWQDVGFLRVIIQFVAPIGLIEADTASTQSRSGTGTVSVTNAGTAVVSPVIRITGPVTNPSVANTTTGRTFALTGTVSTGQWVDVDMAARTVLRDNGANWRPNVNASTSSWWVLRPGAQTITFSGSGTGGGTGLQVTWRDGWVW